MRGRLALACALASCSLAGCLVDRGPLLLDAGADAFVDPERDASIDAARAPDADRDAPIDPDIDAWATDAFVDPDIDAWAPDAFVVPPDAWSPDAPPDAFVPPDACAPRCDGDTLVACDGMRTTCAACGPSSVDATPHCLTLAPSNTPADHTVPGDAMDAVIDGAGDVEWDTGSCTRGALRVGDGTRQLNATQIRTFTPMGGVSVCIVSTPRFELGPDANLTVTGSRPLVIVARDSIVVRPGARLSVGSSNDEAETACAADVLGAGARSGTSPGAGRPGVSGSATFNPDSGGGGGSYCGVGGAGGDGTGGATGGDPGAAVDPMGLVPIYGGSPGGNGPGRVGEGGAGGGALQLSAREITIEGALVARGAGGLGGGIESGGRLQGAGGGGGSGGAIHLEALTLTLAGTSMLDVRGGGGGGAGCHDGEDAQIGYCAPATEAPPFSDGGSDGCGANAGGRGASGSIRDGAPGDMAYDGNGGGGGSGCIVLRSRTSPTPITAPSASGVVSTLAPSLR